MKPTSKEAKRDALDLEFEKGKMHVEEYHRRLEVIRLEATASGAPTEPDIHAVVRAVKATLEGLSATLTPLMRRVTALEQKLRKMEANGSNDCSVDGMAGMAASIMAAAAALNATLERPVQPIYNQQGILIGARRVRDLDS